MSDLPETWKFMRMLDILPIVPTGVVSFAGEVPYFSTGSIQGGFAVSEGNYTFETRPARANRWVIDGDIIQARMKGADKSFLIDSTYSDTLFSTGFLHFRPNPNIYNSKLFKFYLSSKEFLDQRDELATGSTQEALTDANANKLTIPLPPLNEQKRIVEKLEKLLGKVEAVQARLDKIPAILKRFRQAVLAAACSGKLTNNWRGGEELKNWKETILEEVIIGKPKNGYSAKPVNYETKWRVLTLTATTSGRFSDKFYKFFDEEIPDDSQFWIQPNDILVQRGNTIEYVGVSAIYDGQPNQFIYPDLMMRLRAKGNVSTKYLYFALSWEKTRNYLRENATGTAGNMPKINQTTLINAPINLPPLEEQKEIVRRVEDLFKFADQIETRYKKARNYTDKLTQSILAKAFRGDLVEQDPNDEPASLLLDRIRLLREEQEKKPKKTVKVKRKNMKLTKEKIEETIQKLPDDKFSFDELSKHISSDYESIKVLFFDLLDDPKPIITQIFDQQTTSIQFIREQK